MGAPLPGAVVSLAVMASPARAVTVTMSGESPPRAVFWAGVAGASRRS